MLISKQINNLALFYNPQFLYLRFAANWYRLRDTPQFENITHLLENDFGGADIKEFVNDLIESQFLTSTLQPGLTLGNELGRFKRILIEIGEKGGQFAKSMITIICEIEDILGKLNTCPLGKIPVRDIAHLKAELQKYGISDGGEHLFHIDLLKPPTAEVNFSEQDIHEIESAIRILSRLSAPVSLHEQMLQQFKNTFLDKYGTSAVALMEALDPEAGIGFPVGGIIGDVSHNPFIEKISAFNKKEPVSMLIDKVTLWLHEKTDVPNTPSHLKGIQLSENDLKDFSEQISKLPYQFSVLGTKLPDESILLRNVGGASANSLLGRFAYMNDVFSDFCTSLSDDEKMNFANVVFADILHTPEGHIGNIARRIRLSEYEIPILNTTGSKLKTIYLDDLFIKVENDEIVLFSKSLDKRVIPRLSNAHNYQKSMIPAYKFLAAIQHQNKLGLNVHWGLLDSRKRFLPRISFKKIVLHRATWNILPDDVTAIIENKDSLAALKEFIEKWHVPQFVTIAESDNELLIDTLNESYLEILLTQLRKRTSLKLVEWLYGKDCKNFYGQTLFANQFILSLSRKNIAPFSSFECSNKIIGRVVRSFSPGSEWLYFKIYCSAFISDDVLSSVVAPAIQCLTQSGIIEKAFFIRYKDPHYHIRFRMLLSNADDKHQLSLAIEQVYKLLKPRSADRSVWKVQIDTYEREIERYGEDCMEISESIFFHDSLLLLNILNDSDFTENDDMRFLASLKNIDCWLTLFGLDLSEKLVFCETRVNKLSSEFGRNTKFELDAKYRGLKESVLKFMQSDQLSAYFQDRFEELQKLYQPQENLANYIHMSLNRWFALQQRLHEYMAYDFCCRYYKRLLHDKSR